MGADVTAMVYYNSFNSYGWLDSADKEAVKGIKIFSGDIRSIDSMKKEMKGIDVVFHLAALIAIPYSYISPSSYIKTNVQGTLCVLQAALDNGVEKLVHTSTSEVYGSAKYIPIDEVHPQRAQSPYAASKIGADKIAESFYLSFGLPVAMIRPFNTYGPRQSARAIIPTIISQVLSGKTEIELGSLEPTRDFTFVHDTVKAFIKIAESDKTVGEVVNAGSGKEISIGDLGELIIRLSGKQARIVVSENRKRPPLSEVDRLCADFSKCTKLTSWAPNISLEEGINETILWAKNNLKHYKAGEYNL
jgi:NAD dependent epimerase/dehydratase